MADGGAVPTTDGAPRLAAIVAGGEAPDGSLTGPLPAARPPRGPRPAPALGRGSIVWRIFFVLALVAAIVAIPFLALMGKDAVEDSTRGRVIGVVTDPSEPGYEVLVEPSPTMLLVQTDGESLEAVTFLALSSASTGSTLFLPPTTGVETPGGPVTLRDAWEEDGEEGLTSAVEQLLGVGIADFSDDGTMLPAPTGDVPLVRIDRSQWAQLVAPVAPITVDNPDAVEVVGADGEVTVRFPVGEVALEADAVGIYLAARGAGESDLNRMIRHERFWTAWIAAVASGGSDAIVGEQDSGLGRYVSSFAEGEVGFVAPEARTVRIPGTDEDGYVIEAAFLESLVPAMVPFPTSPQPGDRPAVRVLDGTGTPDAAITAARDLARAGAEIRAIGNGPTFDQAGTQIIYYDAAHEAAAQAMQEALGEGDLELRPNPDEVITVTVVLGPDVVDGLDIGG